MMSEPVGRVEAQADPSSSTAPPLPQPAPPRRRVKARQWAVHGLLLALGIGLLVWFANKVDGTQMRESFGRIGVATFGMALVIYTAAWGFRAWRLHFLIHAIGLRLPLREAASVALGANALNLLAPARMGDVGAFLRLREVSSQGAAAAAAVVTWRLADMGAVLVLTLFAGLPALALVPLSGGQERGVLLAVAAGAGFLLLSVLIVWAVRHHRIRGFLASLATRLLGSKAPVGAAFGRALAVTLGPRTFAIGLALAVSAWVCDLAVACAVVQAVTARPDGYALAIIPFVLGNVAKVLPTTPGGIGVFEGVFAGALHYGYGIEAQVAFAAAFALHLFMNLYTLVLGVPGAVRAGSAVSRAIAGGA